MRSVKPGRGPSAMGAVGGVIAVVFGIFWTMMAFQLTRDAPFPLVGTIFPLFGVVFVVIGVISVIYSIYNTISPNRLSQFDITDNNEEPDPLNRLFGKGRTASRTASRSRRRYEGDFCPFCGAKIPPEADFCPNCGKDV